ncbi:hypothetical protein OG689_20635 [Kitasatospora sp. NBC_00240]|uniref:hypothetical protein n=1 Tax=Kitasatospora sp. NBC_00240 TaxID=2903567 RepID=UPI00225032BE|nr:hypothetical protein [Kitasatospora sp. NBC_00240]MCX5211668.1 hypothetical protein [Kitasatospora sp. NBC_00240]
MNLDFSAEPLFSWYVVLLCISGVAMVAIGAVNFGALSIGWRIFNAVAGVGFLGYGIYLGFIFEGGEYLLFFKAFILPGVLIFNFVRSLATRGNAPAPQVFQPAQAYPADAPAQPFQPAAPAQPAPVQQPGQANQAG